MYSLVAIENAGIHVSIFSGVPISISLWIATAASGFDIRRCSNYDLHIPSHRISSFYDMRPGTVFAEQAPGFRSWLAQVYSCSMTIACKDIGA